MEPTDLGESDHAFLFPLEKWLVELRTVPGLLHAQVLAPCLAWMATGKGGGAQVFLCSWQHSVWLALPFGMEQVSLFSNWILRKGKN